MFKRSIVLALVLTLLTAVGGLWWMCARNEAIAFLSARAGAEWIVFPRPAETTTRDPISVTVEFRHSFTVNTKPAGATLAICAFKGAAVAINIRLKPDHAEAHNNLGTVFGRKGQTEEAIRQFQEAL